MRKLAWLTLIASLPCLVGWGPIGHRMIAETAAVITAEPSTEWKELLARHRFQLGYYAVVPDSLFKLNQGALESPTHFFDLDLALGLPKLEERTVEIEARLEEFPRSLASAERLLRKQLGPVKGAQVGTLPWRIAQLTESARKALSAAKAPKGEYISGLRAKGDERALYEGLLQLGLLAHYTADSTMPYHATSDYNGWATGQGGIHFYFETDCVDVLEPGLSTEVLAESLQHRSAWLTEWKAPSELKQAGTEETVGLVLRVLLDDFLAVSEVARIDREKALLKASESARKQTALRRQGRETCLSFRPLLVQRLAKGAVLTSYLWSQVLPRNADLSRAKSLQFFDLIANPSYPAPLRR